MAVPLALAGLAGGIGKAGAAAKIAGDIFSSLPAKIGMATAGIAALVKIANPAAFERFNWAMQDVLGVVGRMLTPVLDGLTDIFRTLGGILETMRPAIMPLTDFLGKLLKLFAKLGEVVGGALAPVFESIGKVIETILIPVFKLIEANFKIIAPIIKLLAIPLQITAKLFEMLMETMQPVIGLIEMFAEAMEALGEVLSIGVSDLMKSLGLVEGKMKSSVGAAVRPAQYSSIEDVGKRSSLAAFGQGSGDPMLDAAKRQAAAAERIDKKLESLLTPNVLTSPLTALKKIGGFIEKLF